MGGKSERLFGWLVVVECEQRRVEIYAVDYAVDETCPSIDVRYASQA